MLIRTVVVTPFFQNARVFIDEKTRDAVVVDPGGEIEKILPALELNGEPCEVSRIFLTHSHIDHAGGVEPLRRALKARGKVPEVLAHRLEAEFRANIVATALMFGLPPEEFENSPEPDRYVDEGEGIRIGESSGKLLFTPGHSPGHLSLYFPRQHFELESAAEGVVEIDSPLLLGGDVIFQESIGRTDLPGGNYETLIRSVREKIFTLPDETRILCGHGGDTTVGHEKKTNPFFT